MYAEVGSLALGNMFDNYLKLFPQVLATVHNEVSAKEFVVRMLEHYKVLEGMVFNPELEEEEVPRGKGEDDLYVYYLEFVIRFLPSLALDLCEEEGDAKGLLAIERLMCAYFLASNLKSQNVKYADFTLFDVVNLLSSSDRTKQRMMDNPVLNLSGTSKGGMFFDKYCEVVVRMIKECLVRQHGGLDDILIAKDIGGLSVLASLNHHQRMSLLKGKIGKEHSQDYVKESARVILTEQIRRLDPFSCSREVAVVFHEKPRGNPYAGLKKKEAVRFITRKGKEDSLKY